MTSGSSEPDWYYAFSATLRIQGANLPLEEISGALGVDPTHQHRKGEVGVLPSRLYESDAWMLTAPLRKEQALTEHLQWLWQTVERHAEYIKSLGAEVDVFCGYRSNNDGAGFHIEPDALRIFTSLNIPLSVSVIIL